VGERARRRLLGLCLALFLLITGVGLAALRTFLVTPRQPVDVSVGESRSAPAPAVMATDQNSKGH